MSGAFIEYASDPIFHAGSHLLLAQIQKSERTLIGPRTRGLFAIRSMGYHPRPHLFQNPYRKSREKH